MFLKWLSLPETRLSTKQSKIMLRLVNLASYNQPREQRLPFSAELRFSFFGKWYGEG
jgi:hypothetical protein